MAADGEARVRLRVIGRREVEREVQRTARGITREAKKAQQEQKREEQRAVREEQQRQKQKARRQAIIEREIVRMVREAEREKRREQTRTVREAIRNARTRAREEARAAREAARAQQRAAREAERGRRGGFGALATVGAVGVGLGASGLGAARRAQGVLGIPTQDEALRSFHGFQQNLIRTGSEAGLAPADIQKLQQEILQTSRATNFDPNELLAGLGTAQARFDKLDDFRSNLAGIARVAKASGAGLDEVIGAAGEAQRAFGLTSQELEEFLNVAFVGARRGSIEFSSIASDFSNVFGTAAAALGQRGIGGARETLALSQVLGTSGQAPAEVATMTERTLETLLDRDVQKRFRSAGIEVADSEGRLRPLQEIARQLAGNRALNDPRKLQELVGGRIEARRGIRVLRQRAIDNPELFGSLQGISATEGAGQVDQTVAQLIGSVSGQAESKAIDRLISVFEDGGRLTDAAMAVAEPLNQLEREFPLLTAAVQELQPAIYSLMGVMVASKLFGGGAGGAARGLLARGAGAAAAAGAGAGGGTGAAIGGASLASGAAVVGGAAAIAGVGYHILDAHQRLSQMESVREAQVADVEQRITNAGSPEELDAALAEGRGLHFGERQRSTVPSGADALLNSPFLQQRTPTVHLDEDTIRQLRQGGIGQSGAERRGAGGPARRTP